MKQLLIFFFIGISLITVFLSMPQAHAAISFVASSSAVSSAATVLHVTQTSTSTTNRILMCGLSWNPANGTATATSIVADGVAMTFDVGTTSAATVRRAESWHLINPGTGNISVTSTIPTSRSVELWCSVFAGVDQTTGIDATSSAIGVSTLATVSVATQANEVVWNVVADGQQPTSSILNTTVIGIDTTPASISGGVGRGSATSTTLITGFNLDGSATWADVAVSLKVAAAATAGSPISKKIITNSCVIVSSFVIN